MTFAFMVEVISHVYGEYTAHHKDFCLFMFKGTSAYNCFAI